jgi:antitoxin (DNA-binding transcriptional repressor) of toxin-antitoxin stability system
MRAEPDGLAAGDLLPSTLFVHRCTMMYMTHLSVSEARAILPELLDRVERGEEITITRHGRPAAVMLRPDSVRMRRAKHTIDRAREVAALLSAGRDRPLPAPALSVDHAEGWAEAVRADRDR